MSLALSPRRAILMPGPWVQDELWRRARAVPSLDLRFAERKDLIDVISGLQLITYTRVGSGTFVGSGGLVETAGTNVPRFDHDPTTGECLGLLVEEQRTNLLLHSRTLTDVAWVAANITPAKNETGADGVGNSASSITATAANGTILQTVTSASAARATSAYVRRITGTGVVEMTQNGGTTWTAITVTSSWSRVSIPSATVTNPSVGFRIATSGDAIAVDYVQCETGTFVTSAIETTTAEVTRNVDVVSITGTNFSSWFNQNAITLRVEGQFVGGTSATFPRMAALTNASINSNEVSVAWTANSGILRGAVTSDGVVTADLSTGLNKSAGSGFIAAITASAGGAQFASDGSLSTEDTSIIVPTCDRLLIAQPVRFQNAANTTIRRLTYWPQRLSNSALQALTR